ncbi:Secretory component protein SHR3 [Leucoagaricus sp. SymC.cos]|nr:Secretory component protein SHR3 [Leucoagaricus sp. SymC.cos]
MGFKQAAVLAPVSFFLGVQFICFNVDHRILWGSGGLTDEVVADGFQFYATFFNAPPAIKALLHGMIGIGLVGTLSKLFKWDESAMFFDGSSLAAYVFSIAIYLTVTIPALRTIVTPLEEETREVQVEALSVLCAGNVIIAGCLFAVLVLQAGQEYARRQEARELARMEKEQKDADASVKKDQ